MSIVSPSTTFKTVAVTGVGSALAAAGGAETAMATIAAAQIARLRVGAAAWNRDVDLTG
jgi:hypothetical protein